AAGVSLVGIEPAGSMLERCREKLRSEGLESRVALINAPAVAGLAAAEPAPAVVILNYTLQFIPPGERPDLLARLCRRLLPGGCIILSEKVRAADPAIDEVVRELHHGFKRDNGYSELEIARKREALDRVLIPWTIEENCAALVAAGFGQPEIVLK